MSKIPIYLVFGPQGSGKSTQAELLSEHLKLPFFDSGSQLRELAHSDKVNSQEIISAITAGDLVSNDILRSMFGEFISNHDCSMGMVIDGFPRTVEQGKLLKEMSKVYNWNVVSFYVEITDKTAKERLSKRYQLVNGKKVFRDDDKPSIVNKRLELFKKETLPVIEELKEYFTVHSIDGEPNKVNVFMQIKKYIANER